MTVVRERAEVELPPERAAALWTDVSRWPTFIEGFWHVVEQRGEWPEEGSRLVWQSVPEGRGRVTEKVREWGGGTLVTDVFEEALTGTQTVRFSASEDARSIVEIELDYRLSKGGPLGPITDFLFIRRALAASLRRVLGRFSAEAAEEASL